jgi:hypothetical protein
MARGWGLGCAGAGELAQATRNGSNGVTLMPRVSGNGVDRQGLPSHRYARGFSLARGRRSAQPGFLSAILDRRTTFSRRAQREGLGDVERSNTPCNGGRNVVRLVLRGAIRVVELTRRTMAEKQGDVQHGWNRRGHFLTRKPSPPVPQCDFRVKPLGACRATV